MNGIVNNVLLAGDKFMPEMHLKQPRFTYSAFRPFSKNKERIQKFKETGDASYIYKNELDKACFQHDMAYEDFKDLAKRTCPDKILRYKAFKIASDQKYDRYQRGLASMVYKFFDKKTQGSGRPLSFALQVADNKENIQLANELHKPIIRNFKKRKFYSLFRDNIWGVDLAEMQLLTKYNQGYRFLLCVIDIYSKYARVIPLKDKNGVSIVNAFRKIIDDSKRRPNKIWVDKGSEFYNNSFKKWMKENGITMYSTNSQGKSITAERFIRTLKTKSYKYMTSISKNVYINKLDDIVEEYNNKYHTSIKMKSADVQDNTYIDSKNETNNKNPKFKVGDHVKISKYKNIFAKGYMPNWPEEVFVIKRIENTVPWTYVINDLNGEEIIGTFYKEELQGTNQQEYRIEKIIKKKGDKLYVKWKVYNNSFNSWIDKKDIIKCVNAFLSRIEHLVEILMLKWIYLIMQQKQIKNITHIDTSGFALKTNLASLKTEIDKLDIDKLAPVPVDLGKLSDVVKNDVIKKTTYNAKISEIKGKIPDISNLAAKTALAAVKNKIPDTASLVKKNWL